VARLVSDFQRKGPWSSYALGYDPAAVKMRYASGPPPEASCQSLVFSLRSVNERRSVTCHVWLGSFFQSGAPASGAICSKPLFVLVHSIGATFGKLKELQAPFVC